MLLKASNPEFDLVDRCLKGESKAQRELYDKYKDAMFTLCYRISGDYDMAADILQEGFVKVFRGLKSFRRESTLGAWIKTIVIRTAYNAVKKQKIFFVLEYVIEFDECKLSQVKSSQNKHEYFR